MEYDFALHGDHADPGMVLAPVKLRLKSLFMSRHGESQFNEENKLGGNSSLSAAGDDYATRLCGVYHDTVEKDLGVDPSEITVWTSALNRTVETARFLPYTQKRWKELDEIDAGLCEGMTYEEVAAKYPADFAARKADKLNYRYTQGESYVDLVRRVKPVIDAMQAVEGYLIIIAHQAIARVIHSYLTGSSLGQLPVLELPLHTIYEYTPQPGGGCLVTSFQVPVPCRQLSFRDFVIAYDRLNLSGTISLNSIDEAAEVAEEDGGAVEA